MPGEEGRHEGCQVGWSPVHQAAFHRRHVQQRVSRIVQLAACRYVLYMYLTLGWKGSEEKV